MKKTRKPYSQAEKDLIRIMFHERKSDEEIAERISQDRPGTNAMNIQGQRSKWGFTSKAAKKEKVVKEVTKNTTVAVQIGQAQFMTSKQTALSILKLLAGM